MKEGLKGVDMFKVMLEESETFVEIATQKYAGSQVRMLARIYARIIGRREEYVRISRGEEL